LPKIGQKPNNSLWEGGGSFDNHDKDAAIDGEATAMPWQRGDRRWINPQEAAPTSAMASRRGERSMRRHQLCKNSLRVIMLALAISFVTPAFSATLPTDNEQEILVKATLMTFNDANLTGNYSVLFDKSSKVFRSQVSAEKLSEAFKVFRTKNINLESIVADEIDSSKDPKIDGDGVLHLNGRFKDEEKKVRFDLKFVKEDGAWKILGLNVRYKEE
jgi:hypothetical protein